MLTRRGRLKKHFPYQTSCTFRPAKGFLHFLPDFMSFFIHAPSAIHRLSVVSEKHANAGLLSRVNNEMG